MSEISPYGQRSPLTAGARILRGFRRIGAAIAVIALVIGVITSIYVATDTYNTAHRRYDQAVCIVTMQAQKQQFVMNQYRPTEIDMGASGCSGPEYTATFNSIWQSAQRKPNILDDGTGPFFIGMAITVITAAILYGICWSFGWILAGFTRD